MSTYADMLKKVKEDIKLGAQQKSDFSTALHSGRNDSGVSQGSSYASMLQKVKSDIALGKVTGGRITPQGDNGFLDSANAPLEMTGSGGASPSPTGATTEDYDTELDKLSKGLENLWTRRRLLYKGDSSGYISPGAQREIAALDAEIEKAERRKTQLEGEKKERTWFQKGALEDGYQRGDVIKTAVGTGTDAAKNVATGAIGVPEKIADFFTMLAAANAETAMRNTANDAVVFSTLNGNSTDGIHEEYANMAKDLKQTAATMVAGDLYDEQAVAKTLISNPVKAITGVDAETDSVLGEKSDALLQSAGQLAAQYGLQMVGIPWFATSAATSFGSEAESALQQGATFEEAGVSAAITAGAEILTEKLFGGDLFVNKAGFDVLVDNLTKGIANKFAQKAVQLGLDAAGEGAEEWLSTRIGQFGQWLAYNHDEKELLELLYSEESLEEAAEAFLGGTVLGGGMSGIKTLVSGNKTQQPQSAAQSGANAQGGNGQATQEATAEPAPWSPEWVKETLELGRGVDARKKQQSPSALEYFEETLALGRGDPADPVAAAVEVFKENGTVTNRLAEAILIRSKAVAQLREQVGLELPDTASGRRNAVKEAVARLAQLQVESNTQTTTANEQSGVKEQLRNNQSKLNTMKPAAEISVPTEFSKLDKAGKQNWVVEKLRSTGYKVDRKGFGIIDFARKRLKAAFKYFDNGSVEEAAFEALPYVLENGIEISSHPDHKGRTYRTVTIAAPVIINGKRGNMAVVVKQTDGNHYKVHRILTPDGAVFDLSETTNEADRADGGVTETGSLATSNGAASLEAGVLGSTIGHRQSHSLIPASDISISENEQGVNTSAEESVGAATEGYAENTVGSAQSRFDHKQNTSRVYSNTYANASGEDTRTVGEDAKKADPNIDKYEVITEDESVYNATLRTRDKSEIAFEYDNLISKSGWTGEDNDTAMFILNHLRKTGDVERLTQLARKQREEGTIGAQLVQSFAKYSRMTATDCVLDAVKKIDELIPSDVPKHHYEKEGFGTWKKKLTATVVDIANQIDSTEDGNVEGVKDIIRSLAQFRKTTAWFGTRSDLTRIAEGALKDIDFDTAKAIANAQLSTIPHDFIKRSAGQVAKTVRIHNMLSALTTINRNIVGNASIGIIDATSDSTVGRALDYLVSLATKKRTVGNDVTHAKTYFSAGAKAAKMAALCAELDIPMESESRFTAGHTRTYSPQGNPVMRFLSAYEKYMKYALEVTDQFFDGGTNAAVEKSLEKLGAKSNLTEDEIAALSEQAGKRRTFKDDRMLTRMAKGVKKALNDKSDFGAGDLVMPFAGTGSNVGHVAVDYSTGGLSGLIDIFRVMYDVKTGKYNKDGIKQIRKNGKVVGTVSLVEAQRKAVTNAARGLTGAGLICAFAALAAAGILTVHDDRDEDKRGLEQSMNLSGAQLNISAAMRGMIGQSTDLQDDDWCLSVDFLEPFNAQMYLGYLLSQDDSIQDMVKAYPSTVVRSVYQSLMDMPLMQGFSEFTDTLTSLESAVPEGEEMDWKDAIADVGGQLIGSTVSGFIPSWVRQTAQVIDPYYRDTTGETAGEKATNQVKATIPFLSTTLPKKYSGLGQEQRRYDDILSGIFNTMVNPGELEQIKSSEVAEYLDELSERTGDVTFYPAYIAPGSFKLDGQKVIINGKEDTEAYQLTYGSNVNRLYGELIKNPDFRSASDKQQAKILNSAKDYAVMLAKAKVSDYSEIPSYISNRAKGMSEAEAILRHALLTNANGDPAYKNTEKYASLSVSDASYLVDLVANLKPEKAGGDVSRIQKIEAIAGSRLTEAQQKAALKDTLDDNLYEKYLEVLGLKDVRGANLDTDDYADSYRAYLEEKEIGGKGTKARTIKQFQQDFGLSYDVAKQLYEIYG